MGRAHFVIEEKVLLIFFYCDPIIIFLISSTSAPNIVVSVEPCLASVGGMRGCSGTDEDEAGKKKKSQYTHYKKTRLHHCFDA